MRREMAAKEAELSKQVSAAKESWNQGEKRKAEIKAQLSPIDSKLNQYTQWLEAYETNLSALTEAKAARKKKDQEEQELLLQKEELVLQLKQAKEVLKSCELELEGSQRLGAEADQLEEANNDIERSIVVPGRLEMVRLAENKENLAMKIGEQHKDSVAAEAREKEELDLKVEEKKKVSEELLELKEKLEGEKSKNQHYLRVEKEFRENWDREISQYNTLEEKLRNAFEAGKAPIHEAEIARQAERDARIEEAGAQSQDMRDRSDRYVQILLYGAETIKNGEERLYVLNDDPMIDL